MKTQPNPSNQAQVRYVPLGKEDTMIPEITNKMELQEMMLVEQKNVRRYGKEYTRLKWAPIPKEEEETENL